MKHEMFEGLTKAETKQLLEDNADKKINDYSYQKPFTPEEIEVKKSELAEVMIKKASIEDELKEIKDEYKEKLKPLQETVKETLSNIKYKSRQVRETVFILSDFESEKILTVNDNGELINERKMLPEEKQLKLEVTHRKIAANE